MSVCSQRQSLEWVTSLVAAIAVGFLIVVGVCWKRANAAEQSLSDLYLR